MVMYGEPFDFSDWLFHLSIVLKLSMIELPSGKQSIKTGIFISPAACTNLKVFLLFIWKLFKRGWSFNPK